MRNAILGVIGVMAVGLAGSANGQTPPSGAGGTEASAAATPAPANRPARAVAAPTGDAIRRVGAQPAPGGQAGTATTRPARPFTPYTGVVAGSNVYVRSGPGTNYYPVTKLQRGHRVQVVGQEFDWVEIAVVKGTYSVIDQRYVDRSEDGTTGVVNGDDVYVRAGSDLSLRRHAMQVKLSKGAEVKIIGAENEAGFYQIEPPKGATLWMSQDFVRRAGADEPAPPAVAQPGAARRSIREIPAATPPARAPQRGPGAEPEKESLRLLPAGATRDAIVRIEEELTLELRKSPLVQNLNPYAARLEAVAQQADETVAKIYAEQRAKQLRNWMSLVADVKAVRQKSRALPVRRDWRVQPKGPRPDEAWDISGELRPSDVFNRKGLPTRYRLVDAAVYPARTIAYLEMPPDSTVDLTPFLGQRIRVRAANRRALTTVGRSIPIIVPKDIGVQEAPAETAPAPTTQPTRPEPAPATGDTKEGE